MLTRRCKAGDALPRPTIHDDCNFCCGAAFHRPEDRLGMLVSQILEWALPRRSCRPCWSGSHRRKPFANRTFSFCHHLAHNLACRLDCFDEQACGRIKRKKFTPDLSSGLRINRGAKLRSKRPEMSLCYTILFNHIANKTQCSFPENMSGILPGR